MPALSISIPPEFAALCDRLGVNVEDGINSLIRSAVSKEEIPEDAWLNNPGNLEAADDILNGRVEVFASAKDALRSLYDKNGIDRG